MLSSPRIFSGIIYLTYPMKTDKDLERRDRPELALRFASGAYLASEEIRSGRRSYLATKPFNTRYFAHTSEGIVVINGEQIVKIEAVKKGDNWDVIFYLAGGTSHTVGANAWTKQFVPELL